jgi:hypothetical protein
MCTDRSRSSASAREIKLYVALGLQLAYVAAGLSPAISVS